MRTVPIMTPGRIVPDEIGGPDADAALTHAARHVWEFAIALDAFEEDGRQLDDAKAAQRATVEAASRNVIVETETGPHREVRVYLAEDAFHPVRYWIARRAVHAKAAVIALEQVRQALSYDEVKRVPIFLNAKRALDAAVPALKPIRDSVAHAAERRRGRAQKGKQVYDLTIRESPMRLSTLMSDPGYCDGDHFVMKVVLRDGRPDIARVEISEATLQAVRRAIQALFDAVPWRLRLSAPEPVSWAM